MILLHRRGFGIAGYHGRQQPGDADEALAQGLVLQVEIAFEQWLDGTPLRADAFLDPGADNSFLSRRWIEEQAEAAGTEDLTPAIDEDGALFERLHILIAGRRLPLGDPQRPLWVGNQGEVQQRAPQMPGFEDLLLGRDFITQHGLLVVIDGEHRELSILAPEDRSNRTKRDRILEMFQT